MKPTVLDRLCRLLKCALAAAAIYYLLAYAAIAILRMPYPFELEWAEGGSLAQVNRILAGQKLYVSPSLQFVPYIYPPLYFYLSAAVARLTGPGFLPLRLVSFLASLGSIGIIFLLVRRETGNSFAALLGAGLFAACFRLGGAWFDVARIDSLFLFFLLAALYVLQREPAWGSYTLAGLLLSASFLTKQTALAFAAPLVLYAVIAGRRHALALLATVALVAGLGTWAINAASGGWYYYYAFVLPQQHTIMKSVILNFWRRDLLEALPLASFLAAFYFFASLASHQKRRWLFYLLAAAAMLGGSWAARLNLGGARNALFPALAMIAILFALAIQQALEAIRTLPATQRPALEAYVFFVGLAQFVLLAYNPLPQIPSPRDAQAGWQLVQTIRQLPGDVFIPSHGYLATLAGKSGSAHWMAMGELFAVYGGTETPAGAQLAAEIRQAIRDQRFSAIILDSPWALFQQDIDRYYTRQGSIFQDERVFRTVTGEMVRPEWIYVPKTRQVFPALQQE